MRIFGLFTLLLLVGCGGSGGSSNGSKQAQDRSQDPYSCQNPSIVNDSDRSLCMDKADWFITSTKKFPKNFSIKYVVTYDGKEFSKEIMDMCKGKKVSFSKDGEKTVAHFYEMKFFNETDGVNLVITDRGEDCSSNAIFFSDIIPSLRITDETHTKVSIELYN